MSTVRERAVENVTGIVSMLILGLGFVALFAGVEYFFLVWVFGFAVVVPIVAMLFEESGTESATVHTAPATHRSSDDTSDALTTLRERYARGDLTDEQFERKLDRLFETDSPENAADWRASDTDRERLDERT